MSTKQQYAYLFCFCGYGSNLFYFDEKYVIRSFTESLSNHEQTTLTSITNIVVIFFISVVDQCVLHGMLA